VRVGARELGCAHKRACVRTVLLIQHATHMRHIVTSFVAPLAPPDFSTLCHKRHGYRKNVFEHKMCIFIISTTFVYNISHSEKNLTRCCHKCEKVFMYSNCYSCLILMKLEFSQQIFEKNKPTYQISSNSTLWESSCYMRKDGRKD
jgi:hypothetical protein